MKGMRGICLFTVKRRVAVQGRGDNEKVPFQPPTGLGVRLVLRRFEMGAEGKSGAAAHALQDAIARSLPVRFMGANARIRFVTAGQR
jgi:hypothetical protein